MRGDLICISLDWDLNAGGASGTAYISWLGVDVSNGLLPRRINVHLEHSSGYRTLAFVVPKCLGSYKYGVDTT